MAKSHHTRGFEVACFLVDAMANMDDDDRQDIFEGLRLVFCLFCGRKHPDGEQCCCYSGEQNEDPIHDIRCAMSESLRITKPGDHKAIVDHAVDLLPDFFRGTLTRIEA